jgi:hypothetical protein
MSGDREKKPSWVVCGACQHLSFYHDSPLKATRATDVFVLRGVGYSSPCPTLLGDYGCLLDMRLEGMKRNGKRAP